MTGRDLKEWRRRNGNMSQRRLSELTGVSWQTVSNYECDRTPVARVFILALETLERRLGEG